MSTVRVYRSTDPGAPPHPSATRGSMAALIRACLVTGYGNIAISGITVAGGSATATITNNPLGVGAVIAISGATPATLNAEWKITAADATTVTFNAPGIADVTATGTISATLPGAGWEEPYAEVNNYACFRALEGARQFYQIDDNFNEPNISVLNSYDSMSDVLTGTGFRGSRNFGKTSYNAEDSTVWFVIADERTCYVMLQTIYGFAPHGFGDFYSYLSEDTIPSFLAGHQYTSYMYHYQNQGDMAVPSKSKSFLRIPLSIDGTIPPDGYGSYNVRVLGGDQDTYYPFGGQMYPYSETEPDYQITRGYLVQIAPTTDTRIRGYLRGIYYPEANKPKTSMETFTVGSLTVLALDLAGSSSSYAGQIFIDISDMWEG